MAHQTHTTTNRLVDAIERAKHEVFKSREVLQTHLSSVPGGGESMTPYSAGRQAGVSPVPSASGASDAAPLYRGGMGQPVGTPFMGLNAWGRSASGSAAARDPQPTPPAAFASASGAQDRSRSADPGASAAVSAAAASTRSRSSIIADRGATAATSPPQRQSMLEELLAAATPSPRGAAVGAGAASASNLSTASVTPAQPPADRAPAAVSDRVAGSYNAASEALANARNYLASLPPLAPTANPPIQYSSAPKGAEVVAKAGQSAAGSSFGAAPGAPPPSATAGEGLGVGAVKQQQQQHVDPHDNSLVNNVRLGSTVISVGAATSEGGGDDLVRHASAQSLHEVAAESDADDAAPTTAVVAAAASTGALDVDPYTLSTYHTPTRDEAGAPSSVLERPSVAEAVASMVGKSASTLAAVPLSHATPFDARGEETAQLREEVTSLRAALRILEQNQPQAEPTSPPAAQQVQSLHAELQKKRDELSELKAVAETTNHLRSRLAATQEESRRHSDDARKYEQEAAHWRRQAEAFERDLADARRQLAAAKQDFAQQKAQLLLRYAEQQAAAQVPATVYAVGGSPQRGAAEDDAAAAAAPAAPAGNDEQPAATSPSRRPPAARGVAKPAAKKASSGPQPASFLCDGRQAAAAAATPAATPGSARSAAGKRSASRSRTPEPAPQPTPASRRPPTSRMGAASRSRTPENKPTAGGRHVSVSPSQAPTPPPAFNRGDAPSRSASPKVSTYINAGAVEDGGAAAPKAAPTARGGTGSGFSRRTRPAIPTGSAEDHAAIGEPSTRVVPVSPLTDPPEGGSTAMAQWKVMLAGQRKPVRGGEPLHPCVALPLPDIDLSLDAEVAPCTILGGERKEIAPGLYILHHASYEGNRAHVAFYNTLHDTQFNLRYTFSDGSAMAAAHGDVVEQSPGDFGVAVYPGETKPFVTGVSKSSRMSLSFGPVEDLERHPRGLEKDLRAEIEAVKLLLRGGDAPRRVSTADVLALCEKHCLRFVDPTFPPLHTSIARWCHHDAAPLHQQVWAWRRIPTDARGAVTAELSAGSLTAPSVLEALNLAALAAPQVLSQCMASSSPDSHKILLRLSGWWHGVVVDNYFPVNTCGEPMHLHHRAVGDQKWPSAVEKALAKALGGYAALHEMSTGEVFAALAGFAPTVHPLFPGQDEEVWGVVSAVSPSSIVYATTRDSVRGGVTGLQPLRSFAVLATKTVSRLRHHRPSDTSQEPPTDSDSEAPLNEADANTVRLVKIQPLSDGKWAGAWSPMSDAWTPEASVACAHDPSDGTQWIEIGDLMQNFETVSVFDMAWFTAPQMNVCGYFDAGHPDTVVHIFNEGPPVEAEIAIHQKSGTALGIDPDAKRAAITAGVVCQRRDDSAALVAVTGPYAPVLASSTTLTLRSGTYYVIPQCAQQVDKSYVVSIRSKGLANFNISFVTRPKGPTKERLGVFPLPFMSFQPKAAHLVQGSRAYQVLKPDAGVGGGDMPASRQASRSSMASSAATAVQLHPQGACSLTLGAGSTVKYSKGGAKDAGVDDGAVVGVRRNVEKRAPSPQPSTGIAAASLPLEVVVVSAKDLNLMAANPACYCEVKLVRLNSNSEWLSVPSTLKRTRYVPGTVSPTWSTTIAYPSVTRDDYLFLNCFDRDLFAQEEIGEVLLSLTEFFDTLAPGGPPSINWYQLQGQGATGCVQLSLSIPASAVP